MFDLKVQVATSADFHNWLSLASEVEFLFGPMVDELGFHQALRKNFDRQTAFCIREEDGPPGTPLLGGLLFSPHPPVYKIGWLATAQKARRQGVGICLMNDVYKQIHAPAELTLVTFGPENEAGLPARLFYQQQGFIPAERVENGPEGGSRQLFRLYIR